MPRTAAQNQVIKDKRRIKFLESAIRVAYATPYQDIVIDDITKDAGSSHGLFYHYFKTKEECYAAAVEEIILSSPYAVPLAKAKELGGAKGLTLLAEFFSDLPSFTLRQRRIAQFSATATLSDEFKYTLPAFSDKLDVTSLIKELIVAGQAAGEVIVGNPDELAKILYCAILGGIGQLHYADKPSQGISKASLLRIILR